MKKITKKTTSVKKYEVGGKVKKQTRKENPRIKEYESKGWTRANKELVQSGYSEPKDTLYYQYLKSPDKKAVVGMKKFESIQKKKTGGLAKYAKGGVAKKKK